MRYGKGEEACRECQRLNKRFPLLEEKICSQEQWKRRLER